jgi:valyl-tRNA synthetase
LRNLSRGEAYAQEAPTLWDVDFGTAVAQAELEDRERPGAFHDISFKHESGGEILIATTRPELIPACVALVAHPDDDRYKPFFGTMVRSPLFDVAVPVLAHELAQIDKGTGIAMVCTFGDLTDVVWWRELNLPTRPIIGRDGRILTQAPDGMTSTSGLEHYAALAGKSVKQAQTAIVEMLRTSGDLRGEPKPITHPVKFYEKGDRPLEIVTSRQWYIRNGGRDADLRAALLARGDQLAWHPEFMQHRYSNWVDGLNGDWLVSRQRYFGVPVPLWYRLNQAGEPDYSNPLVPEASRLPIDPSTDVPSEFTEAQRGVQGGFIGDADVLDTWATSSLTPQIAGRWLDDPSMFNNVFPMDVRPQGHDIIRTWLFATTVRSHFEHNVAPWHNAALSGWILDPDRKKMSKSKGNVVTPIDLFEQYGSDAVRYWAASARPGVDTAFSEDQMKVGRKLATKLLNATKFVLGAGDVSADVVPTEPLDVAMLQRLSVVINDATTAFETFDYARALERTESFFWWFCDDYLELVKMRAYGTTDISASARAALQRALSVMQRLFAPHIPFATEEVWSWWKQNSIHLAQWPTVGEITGDTKHIDAFEMMLDSACNVIGVIRRTKTEAKLSQRAEVEYTSVSATDAQIALLKVCIGDLQNAGVVPAIEFVSHTAGDSVAHIATTVRLAPVVDAK